MANFKFALSKLVSNDLSIKLESHELPEWKGRIRFAAQLSYLAKPMNKGNSFKGWDSPISTIIFLSVSTILSWESTSQ